MYDLSAPNCRVFPNALEFGVLLTKRTADSIDTHQTVQNRLVIRKKPKKNNALELRALLTTVRRWGCEALSNLWIHANGEHV